MHRRSRLAVAAGCALALGITSPVLAGTTASGSISLGPGEDSQVKIDESVTITGQTGTCEGSTGTATLTLGYLDNEEAERTAQTTAPVESSGEFTAEVAIPDDALVDEEATITLTQVSCSTAGSQPASRQGGPTNQVTITIRAAVGTLSVDPDSGRTGTTVAVNGTNCIGGDVIVVFADAAADSEADLREVDVTLTGNTFSGTYTIPSDAAVGTGAFLAECPGTDYNEAEFTVLAAPGQTPPPTTGPRPARPAVPRPGTVRFTG
jgi:hypothetical protein